MSESKGTRTAGAVDGEYGANAPAGVRLDSCSQPRDSVEPRGEELIARYKHNYGIGDTAVLTEDMILEHWNLERDLRRDLLASTPENRWDVFERAYDTLYTRLAWLNQLAGSASTGKADSFLLWQELIGRPPQHVYEVGSGRGELISHLAKQGFQCKATEITQQRGKKWSCDVTTLTWGGSDGIHLDRFEPPDTYDVMISNQVIEHMHPEDILDHFKSSWTILKGAGRYIFSTPHRLQGPADVTRVFKHDKPMGMHLKEYTYRELKQLLLNAGFRHVFAVLRLPPSLRRLTGVRPMSNRAYLHYLTIVESVLALLPSQQKRRRAAHISKAILFADNIMMVAQK